MDYPQSSPSKSKSTTAKKKDNILKRVYLSFKENLARPSYLAMSNAVGIFAASLPILGQTYICFLMWLIMRKFKATSFSVVIAIGWTIVAIPVIIPFYMFGYYTLGCAVLGDKSMSFKQFGIDAKDIIKNSTDWESAISNGFFFAYDDIGKPLIIGWIISSIILTTLTYFITYQILKYIQKRKKSNIKIDINAKVEI